LKLKSLITFLPTFHTPSCKGEKTSKHAVEIDYLARLKDKNQNIILNAEDHSEYRWISEDEVNDIFPPEDQEKQAVIKGFRKIKENKRFVKGVDYIGVGIGAVLINKEGKIFLSKRGKKARNERGKWEMPGGGLKFDEGFDETL